MGASAHIDEHWSDSSGDGPRASASLIYGRRSEGAGGGAHDGNL